uniref:baculoviral IAP repeat-containing protein 2-like n=1 Tax=Ciona intestinalis TaxID=7719 RepID=UPI000EF5395E|nr:baculoviral IAP repeat-containing protein 2-like [Ciona intestinalis]|eukprot:XP_026693981.1 baculoviral IAP repeat-containing protein 2-like [Ciona intestinalis]
MQPSGLSGVGEPVRHFVSGQNAEIDIEGFAASPASDDMPAQTALWNKVFSEEKFGTQHPSSDMPAQTARIVHPRAARSIVSAMPFRRTEIQDPWDPSQNERGSPGVHQFFTKYCMYNTINQGLQEILEQIAKAGFYYLGDRDRVKCWYCNRGLQNWDPDDEPWTEHAKWFPICQFVLQQKGPDFVQRIVSRYPNLPHSSIRDQPVPPTSFPVRNPRGVDHKNEALTHEEQINQYMLSDIVQTAFDMGFEKSRIQHIVARRLGSGGNLYISVEELINDLASYDQPNCDNGNFDVTNIPGTSQGVQIENENNESFETDKTSLIEARMRELQEERKCKMCRDKIASIVFFPCGHLCACARCAVALPKCPICRCKIDNCLKKF